MVAGFVHLRVHTEYSVVDGLVRIKPLVEKVAADQMPSVAVTDQSNLFCMVKFYRAAEQAGIKPIIGSDIWLHNPSSLTRRSRLVLLCKDMEGYRNLSRLITRSYMEGQVEGVPQIHIDWLRDSAKGLIALSGGPDGDIGQALTGSNPDQAMRFLDQWRMLFPDSFYLELHRTDRAREKEYLESAVQLAAVEGIPVVATNDVRFIEADDFEAHEARVCIHEGRTLADPRRPRNYSQQQYLRSAREMTELFSDIPEAVENTVAIAQRCNLETRLGTYHLPRFPVPDETTAEEWFDQQARAGLERRLEKLFDTSSPAFEAQRKAYDDRLATEIGVIVRMGFPGYFLIVADFIKWARENDIPVGPGRGSGAGSLAAFALEITDLDPIDYDLLFERFLNPERVSMPDFDVDFCMDRRDEVIDYVAGKYGRDHVSQIITYGTMAAKAVIRDVGRVLGYPYGFVDQIAKMIPFELNITLDRALLEEDLAKRYRDEDEVRELVDLARKLEGITRNAGKHAGGVVIAPEPLTNFMPLYCEQGVSTPVTQFDMSDVEGIGLVKFDFLGLRTLTIIDWTVRDINRTREKEGDEPLDITRLSLDDKDTYELIQRAETTAIFQLESRGMKELIKRLKPNMFGDLIALVALFRPGPLQSGMVDDFIDRKHGRARVKYPHDDLEPILKPTYGVILYQEQVMQIAQVLANYTLGSADMLRRAMGKKKPEEMAKQRTVFVQGAAARDVDAQVASSIFDLMEKFAGYGFNKSHSAAYALVAYQTAWLKAHYPAAFMAAVMSADMDNTDKVVGLIDECRHMNISVLPPDVNRCAYGFTVKDAGAVRYGLGAIKGVGEGAIESITNERESGGEYASFFDLCRRIDLRKANRRVQEALIKAGALDSLGAGRSTLMASLDNALQMAEQSNRNSAAGQNDLFGLESAGDTGSEVSEDTSVKLVAVPEWSEDERLAGEKATLGLYLTGHPIDRYMEELAELTSSPLSSVKPGQRTVAGLVVSLRTINSRRGRMAVVTLDDGTGRLEVVIYAELLQSYADLVVKDRLLVISGKCNADEFSGGYNLTAETVYDMDGAREHFAQSVLLSMTEKQCRELTNELISLLKAQSKGTCPIVIEYSNSVATARFDLGRDWTVRLTDALIDEFRRLFGESAVSIHYATVDTSQLQKG